MNVQSVVFSLTVAALLAGCATPYSETPLVTNFPSTKQPKIQAAAHWNAIAADVASQISTRIKDKSRPLYVLPSTKTQFDRGFSGQLMTALIEKDHTLVKSANGAVTVEIDTQAVAFSANRPRYRYVGMPTAITTGLWALYAVDATAAGAVTAGVAAVDAYEWFSSEFATGKTPQTEIIVTTSVVDGERYLARNTSIYYVADTDASLYGSGGGHQIRIWGD